ncbi:MAG: helix-turn-helix domain-containing protein [Candidatus Limnocylindrales bacterium]
MASRVRVVQEAMVRWARIWPEVAAELREARLALGLTQSQVASAIGTSRSRIGRIEQAKIRRASIEYLVRHGAVVGLRGSFKYYPVGGAIRDAAQARYIARFLERIGHAWQVKLEVPVPIPGDLRAVDVMLLGAGCRIAVEVITRLRDLQAQIRAAQLKQRDLGADRLIIVIAGTHANRAAMASGRTTLLATFELDTRRVLAALATGDDPGRDSFIVLD